MRAAAKTSEKAFPPHKVLVDPSVWWERTVKKEAQANVDIIFNESKKARTGDGSSSIGTKLATLRLHSTKSQCLLNSALERHSSGISARVPSSYVMSDHSKTLGNHDVLEQAQMLKTADMSDEGMSMSRDFIYGLLQECIAKKDLVTGRQVHFLIVHGGFDSLTILGDHLIRLYAFCGSLLDAHIMFCKVAKPSVYTWQAIISAHLMLGRSERALALYQMMQHQGVEPSKFISSCILKACGSIPAIGPGRWIHGQILKERFESDVIIGSALIDMYAKCGSVEEARKVFDKLPNRNVVSWGAMIAGYAQHDHGLPALKLFEQMKDQDIEPDGVIFLCILKACGSMGSIGQGRLIHELIAECGFKMDMVIGNSLVDMYVKCGSIEEARSVFNKLPNRSVVSYGAMIAGYAQYGHVLFALDLFEKMQQESIKPNNVIYMCVLKACSSAGEIAEGRIVHEQIIVSGFESDAVIGSTLIDMYARCGKHEEARKVLDKLPNPDVVSLGAMIAGYAEHGDGLPALELFQSLQQLGIKPDKVTMLCSLKACGSLGAIDQGRLMHTQFVASGLASDFAIGNTLVDMYAKCGSLAESRKVLNDLPNRDVVSWNAVIAGYAQHGRGWLVSQCLENMQEEGLKPDERTYTSILAACSHSGLVDEGCGYFKSMREDHGIAPSVELYSCMVDLLGRAGCFDEALDLLQSIPVPPDIIVWKSLLTSCRTYKNMELGRWCFDQVVHLDPSDAFGYVLLSNIYVDADIWEDAHKIQGLRKCASAGKKPGMAWIEVHNQVHQFVAGNNTHPLNNRICAKLQRLQRLMKVEGRLPQLDLVLESILEEIEDDMLC